MKVLGIPFSSNATDHYRILAPLEAMMEKGLSDVAIAPIIEGPHGIQMRGVHVGELTSGDLEMIAMQAGGLNDVFRSVVAAYKRGMDASDFDVVVMTRQFDQTSQNLLRRCLDNGIPVVYDMDDDLMAVPESNPAYMFAGTKGEVILKWHLQQGETIPFLPPKYGQVLDPNKEYTYEEAKELYTAAANWTRTIRSGMIDCIKMASAVTVTTPALARIYAVHNKNIFVLPNQMRLKEWTDVKPIQHPGEIWFGWSGSSTHLADLLLIEDAVIEVLKNHPKAFFAIQGFANPGELLTKISKAGLTHRLRDFPWTSLIEYREILAGMDVVLAPSSSIRFNESKSDIRVLEAWMCVRPVVVSPTTYGETLKACSEGGFVARTTYDWVRHIGRLLDDKHLRRRCGLHGLKYAADTRSYQVNAEKWSEVYDKVIQDEPKRQILRQREKERLQALENKRALAYEREATQRDRLHHKTRATTSNSV